MEFVRHFSDGWVTELEHHRYITSLEQNFVATLIAYSRAYKNESVEQAVESGSSNDPQAQDTEKQSPLEGAARESCDDAAPEQSESSKQERNKEQREGGDENVAESQERTRIEESKSKTQRTPRSKVSSDNLHKTRAGSIRQAHKLQHKLESHNTKYLMTAKPQQRGERKRKEKKYSRTDTSFVSLDRPEMLDEDLGMLISSYEQGITSHIHYRSSRKDPAFDVSSSDESMFLQDDDQELGQTWEMIAR